MQGVVSKTGGTEAGTLPKYRNDIKNNINVSALETIEGMKTKENERINRIDSKTLNSNVIIEKIDDPVVYL